MQQKQPGRINSKVIGAIFLVVLLLFIFFSKTIYSYNLPNVTCTLPTNGRLNKTETSGGIVGWTDSLEIYAELGGKAVELLVSEGDPVEEGQPLLHLSFDADEIHSKLKELEFSRTRYRMDIETIQNKIARIEQNMDELRNEAYTSEPISDADLVSLEEKMAKKEQDYKKAKITKEESLAITKALYEVGAASASELQKLETELKTLREDFLYEMENLQKEYDSLAKKLDDQDQKSKDDLADKEKNREKQLRDYQYDIDSLHQDLKAKNLDLGNLDLQEEKYRDTLAKYETYNTVYAPADATVISINAKKGQRVTENQLLFTLGLGGEYIVECDIPLDNDFISVGDTCSLYNTNYSMEGTVTKITPSERVKKVTVTIPAMTRNGEIATGETLTVKFEKESASSATLVPNGAVHLDGDGYFVYQVKRRNGLLGKEFYVERLDVYIGDSDADYTEITKGIMFFETIVLYSSKPFDDRETVRLVNEGDFFAD